LQLIVGLGNPGPKFARTRHNFGYWVADAFAAVRRLIFSTGRGDYLVAGGPGENLAVIKPTRFMNESGLPVREALGFYKVPIENMLLIFDDIDLPLGTLRFRSQGSAGGHKGVTSVIRQLGSDEFPRLRLGIATDSPMRPSEKYVLSPFRSKDEDQITRVIQKAVEGIQYYLENGMEQTMTNYNTSPVSDSAPERKANE